MDFVEKARRVFEIELTELRRVQENLDGTFTQAVETILRSVETGGKSWSSASANRDTSARKSPPL